MAEMRLPKKSMQAVKESGNQTLSHLEDSTKILAIELGKFNCMSCLFDTESNTIKFQTFRTYPCLMGIAYLHQILTIQIGSL
jgi:hypothetical protein